MSGAYFQARVTADAERRRRAQDRAAGVRARLPAAVRLLVQRYGAREVVLIGSLATGGFDERSDVDLLVDGLSLDQLLAARDEVADLVGIAVDLVRAEGLSPEWRRFHARWGEVLRDV